MLRTQISLTREERRTLDAVAARTGRPMSALIRDAVTIVYGTERAPADDLEVIRRSFGSWIDHDHDHDVEGAAWVDQRRSGARLSPRS